MTCIEVTPYVVFVVSSQALRASLDVRRGTIAVYCVISAMSLEAYSQPEVPITLVDDIEPTEEGQNNVYSDT